MNRKLKLVFFVTEVGSDDGIAAAGKVVDQQQLVMEIPHTALCAETRGEILARDPLADVPAIDEAGENIKAACENVRRYLDKHLREWARSR